MGSGTLSLTFVIKHSSFDNECILFLRTVFIYIRPNFFG